MYNKDLSRKLRHAPTPTEEILWRHLRDRQINHLKFRRQHPIGSYVVDFYCDKLKLIIEIDGDVHALTTQIAHDSARQKYLEKQGLYIQRVMNNDVRHNIEGILQQIHHLTLTLSSKERE